MSRSTSLIALVLVGLCLSLVGQVRAQEQGARGEAPVRSGDARAPSSYELLLATQQCFRDVAANVRPYVVQISTVGGVQPPGMAAAGADPDSPQPPPGSQTPFRETIGSDFNVADGPTTGIIYSSDGYIITSSFNFIRDPVLISVALADGRRLAAELVARDHVRKIALLKIDATGLALPTWVDHREVRVGQWAVALGMGYGATDPSITAGIISAHSRMHGNAVQTDAKLNPSNYGGPVCDLHSRIVGIAVPMAQRPGELAGIEMYDSGVGFALPKHRVDEIVDVLKTGKSFYRGWLGISLDPRHPEAVVIGRVADPSPVRDAGIEPGDTILSAEERELHHFGHLVQAIYLIPAGESVYLHLARDGREFGKVVTLARNTELGSLAGPIERMNAPEPLLEKLRGPKKKSFGG